MTDDNVIHADFSGRRKLDGPRRRTTTDDDTIRASRVENRARKNLRSLPEALRREVDDQPAWMRIGQAVTRTGEGRNWASQLLVTRVREQTEPGRWGRGADLHKDGKVRQLTVLDSIISAMVQGTQPMPFAVSIQLPERDARLTNHVAGAIASSPAGLFSLTTGRVSGANLQDFVLRDSDRLRYSCECPDPTVPCKHVAAVVLAASAKIDVEPRTILDLRGIDPEDLARRADFERTGAPAPIVPVDGTPAVWEAPAGVGGDEPEEPETPRQRPDFWGGDLPLPEVPDVVTAPAILEADRKLLYDAFDRVCFGGHDTINLVSELAEAYQAMMHRDGDYIDGDLADIIELGRKR